MEEESSGDYFVEISLDSVLRKATELVDSLRQCKARAAVSPVSPAGSEGGGRAYGRSPLPSSPAAPQSPLQAPMAVPLAATPQDTADQWQKLTAYIVSLEKEVQYYKQLVQDVQIKQRPDSRSAGGNPPTGSLATPGGGGGGGDGARRQVVADYWKNMLETDPENHVLLLVFSHLSPWELCQAALVCRKWYTASRHPLLWKELVMTETVVEPQVRYLDFHVGCKNVSATIIAILHISNLQHISRA